MQLVVSPWNGHYTTPVVFPAKLAGGAAAHHIEMCISFPTRLPCHLPALYQNYSSASWWPTPRGFPGSCMISGCNSIWVDLNIALVHKYWSGIEVFRHGAAVPWLSGVSEPPAPSTVAQGLAVGRDRGREQAPLPLSLLRLPSASFIPHLVPQNPQRRPALPVFPRLNIHSHTKKKDLENCVTVPSGDTCPNRTGGRGCGRPGSGSAGGCFPQEPGSGAGKCLCAPKLLSLGFFFAQLSGLL